ncbi:DUF2891 domain-containing protein [Myroides injenensis]|uniref:DUF2891 domain-containing protein n=1 Tax=Myroides injenensis TaxID=1183151 RepID=UPI00028944AF|nr:DUF2891 domain-containing protein [Myroides injenensis]
MKYIGTLLLSSVFLLSCTTKETSKKETVQEQTQVSDAFNDLELGIDEARKIIELPLHCIEIEYPNKLGQVLGQDSDLKTPKQLRPIFYGCFDWHSSVHGFWSIVTLMQKFPEIDENGEIRKRLNNLITKENCQIELNFFEDSNNKNFERTYGWAWLFQLHSALKKWDDKDAQRWADVLEPLAEKLMERYEDYLPKLLYPIRTGTHDNTAFSLSLSLDYANETNNTKFRDLIVKTANRLYKQDQNCNISFEPSGHDFLSPCLEEARLMSKILNTQEYSEWLKKFLPSIYSDEFLLETANVSDRTDGHLVHLDGLNFSRATCLQEISMKLPELKEKLLPLANQHFNTSFKNISGDDYMGSHWLGTFALYTLLHK